MFDVVRTLLFGGFVGKVLAVLRELVAAWLFGTGTVAAAFRVSSSAFTIPLQGFVTEALNTGFTPRFSIHHHSDKARANVLFAAMHAALLLVTTVVAILLFSLADLWIHVLAPGLSTEAHDLAVQMVRILALIMPLYIVTALYAAADLAQGRGQLTASRASVQSLGMLLGVVVAWLVGSPLFIPIGFVAAYAVLAVWGIRAMREMQLPFWPRRGQLAQSRAALMEVWGAFRLLLAVPVIQQIHFVVERRVASTINPAAITALDYARFISDTAVVLLAVPFGMAGLSTMARMDAATFRNAASRSLRILMYVGIPLSALLATHSRVVVTLLFARGAFGADSVAVTSSILMALGAGIWGQLLGYSGSKFLSARGRNKSVLILMSIGVGLNIAINLTCGHLFGPAVLGISSTVNLTVFGLLVLWQLGVLGALFAELLSLLTAAVLYKFAWSLLPEAWQDQPLAAAVGVAVFWGAVLFLIPRHRSAMRELINAMRRRS